MTSFSPHPALLHSTHGFYRTIPMQVLHNCRLLGKALAQTRLPNTWDHWILVYQIEYDLEKLGITRPNGNAAGRAAISRVPSQLE